MAESQGTNAQTGSKRPRVENEMVQDTEVWMDDGNVVIAAVEDDKKKGKTTHLFRCHKSVLSKHSPVFRDLFTMPQSSDTKDIWEGFPLVTLPDPAQDVRLLLRMLYDPA